MDRNQIIGFILIFLVVIGWSIFTSPSPEEMKRMQAEQDSIAALQALDPTAEAQLETAIAADQLANTVQPFDSLAPQRTSYTLENSKVILTFDSQGGFISEAKLKDHVVTVNPETGEETSAQQLVFLNSPKNKFGLRIPVPSAPNGMVDTDQMHFEGSKSGNKLTLRAATPNGGAIVYTYTLKEDGYHLDYDMSFDKIGGWAQAQNGSISLYWENHLDKLERNVKFERNYSTVYFKEANEDPDYCNCISDDEEDTEKRIDWVSNSNQFFNTSLMGRDKPFEHGYFETRVQKDEDASLKILKSTVGVPYSGGQETFAMNLYVGPNNYKDLVAYDNDLEQIIPFGRSIFGTINRYVIRPAFEWLSSIIGSKGLVIIVLIFIIKMLLYPLMYKMLHSQAKMSALKPELEGLKDKFKDEPQKLQMEQMKIYQSYGVSPFGGCLPMLIQMPIWYALFRFFPASITFRQEPFLWAHDLSSYDDFFNLPFTIPFIGDHISLFTILWAISMLAYTYYNTRHMDMSANPAMKYVQYFMPVMFLGFFNNYASGLTCYMLFSNIFNIIQTVGTKKLVFDEDRILAELKEKKAKRPAKAKGGFQQRLESMLEEQRKIQAQQQSQAKKKKKR